MEPYACGSISVSAAWTIPAMEWYDAHVVDDLTRSFACEEVSG